MNPPSFDRRVEDAAARAHMQDHIDRIEVRLASLEGKVDVLSNDIGQVLNIMRAGKAGGAFIKWAAATGFAALGVWATWKGIR